MPADSDSEETTSTPLTPGVNGGETPEQAPTQRDAPDPLQEAPSEDSATGWERWYQQLKPLLGYLPTGTHEEDTERDGLLSYSVEVHAVIIGLAVGAAAATTGNTQLAMALVTIALGVGRLQQHFSETVTSQIVKEPWYALAGVALGYVAVYVAQTGQFPPLPA